MSIILVKELKNISNLEYDYIVIPLTLESPIPKIQETFVKQYNDLTGTILVDTFLSEGNSEFRFVSYTVENGILDFDSDVYVIIDKNTELFKETDKIVTNYMNLISMMSTK